MARNFNGTSDTINASAIATSVTDNLTIACWENPSAGNNNKFVFYNGGNASGYGLSVDPATGMVSIDCDNSNTLTSTATLTNNVWAHVAGVRNSGTWTIYINGVALTPSNSGTTPVAPVGFASAGSRFNAGFWAGSVADCALWTTPLSAGQTLALANGARPIHVNSANLVLWWPLTGLQSPEPDLSGKALNGTVTGTLNAFGPPIMQLTTRWPQRAAEAVAVSGIELQNFNAFMGRRIAVIGY